MSSENTESLHPVALYVDFIEKSITSPSGVMAQGKVYITGYVEIAPWLVTMDSLVLLEGTNLKVGRDVQQKELLQGDWPDELLSEVNAKNTTRR